MAEFGMRNSHSQGSFHQGQAEWYTPSTGYGANSYPAPNSYQPSFMPVSTQPFGANDMASTNFADEPPLLEELGIDLGGILRQTRAILLHRLNNKATEDLDMGGALVFVFLLGGLHLLTGKLHFGIILGWSVVHSAVLWFLVNQLAGAEAAEAKGLELYSICCVVGYCLAPLAVCSALGLMLPRGPVSAGVAVLCVLWASITAAKILVRRCPALEDSRSIIAYPCVLLFSAFAMLSLY